MGAPSQPLRVDPGESSQRRRHLSWGLKGGECVEVHPREYTRDCRALWQVMFELPVVIKAVVLEAEYWGKSMPGWGNSICMA